MSSTLAPVATVTPSAGRINATALRMLAHRRAQRAKRAERSALVQRLMDAGDGIRLVYDCCGGSPELRSLERVPCAAPRHPTVERAAAVMEGRFLPDCEYRGTRRFRWSGKPYVARPFRFLATDFAWNTGGLDGATVHTGALGRRRFGGVRAARPWQQLGSDDGAVVLVRGVADDRILGWQRGKDADNGKRYMAHAVDASADARSLAEWQAELTRVRALHRK